MMAGFALARIAAVSGREREARALLVEAISSTRQLLATGDSPTLHVASAEVLVALGDPDEAIRELETAMDMGFATGLITFREWPWFDSLRGDPRFEEILGRMNYPAAGAGRSR